MFIIESFASAIGVFIVGALFIIWEIKLSKKDAFWKGLIPLGTAVLAMGIAVMLTMFLAGEQRIEHISAKLENGMQAEMMIKTMDGDIIAYGPIEIFDTDGVLVDQCEIIMEELEDEELAGIGLPRYKDVFMEMTKDRKMIARFDSDKEEILDTSLLIFPDDGGQVIISIRSMWKSMFYLCVPLLAIYLMKRRQFRQEKIRREMKKMGVENLG